MKIADNFSRLGTENAFVILAKAKKLESEGREIINLGLSDVLRIYNSKPYEFTYWDYSRGSWEKDNGLRIDHFLATPSAVDRITDCQIEKQFRGFERPSDHVPIWFEIK